PSCSELKFTYTSPLALIAMCLKCPNELATMVAEKPSGSVRSALGADVLSVSAGTFLSLLLLLQADKPAARIKTDMQAKGIFVFMNLEMIFTIVNSAKKQAKLIKK